MDGEIEIIELHVTECCDGYGQLESWYAASVPSIPQIEPLPSHDGCGRRVYSRQKAIDEMLQAIRAWRLGDPNPYRVQIVNLPLDPGPNPHWERDVINSLRAEQEKKTESTGFRSFFRRMFN